MIWRSDAGEGLNKRQGKAVEISVGAVWQGAVASFVLRMGVAAYYGRVLAG